MKERKKVPDQTPESKNALVVAVILVVLVGVLIAAPVLRQSAWLPVMIVPLVFILGGLIGYGLAKHYGRR